MTITDRDIKRHSLILDARDGLATYRERIFIPKEMTYLDGNSLGLISVDAERSVLDALESWTLHGVTGLTEASPAWFTLGEQLGAATAHLVGTSAEPFSRVSWGKRRLRRCPGNRPV